MDQVPNSALFIQRDPDVGVLPDQLLGAIGLEITQVFHVCQRGISQLGDNHCCEQVHRSFCVPLAGIQGHNEHHDTLGLLVHDPTRKVQLL